MTQQLDFQWLPTFKSTTICSKFVGLHKKLSCRMMQQHNICRLVGVISSERTPYLRHLTTHIGQLMNADGVQQRKKNINTCIIWFLFVHSTINCTFLAATLGFLTMFEIFLHKNPISFIGTNQCSDESRPPVHFIPFCRHISITITMLFCTDGIAVGLILIAQ
jgi:hypothetical protein